MIPTAGSTSPLGERVAGALSEKRLLLFIAGIFALVAAYLPARRASRVDPVRVLTEE